MGFRSHKGIAIAVLVAVLAFVLGLLIGYFSKTFYGPNSGTCDPVIQRLISEADQDVSERLFSYIDETYLDKVYRDLTSKPRLAGTDSQQESAEYIHNLFTEYGLTSEIKTYDVLLSYPEKQYNNSASIINPDGSVEFRTTWLEKLTKKDTRHPDEIPAFNAFSPSGDVTAEVIYVNYGRAEDFDKLREHGINCSDKIVLARYGKIYRGNKVKFAYDAGALGIILFSEPTRTPTYPDTWWLPPTGIQRGSIAVLAGDLATPGYPALSYTQRLNKEELDEKLPKIPCHPIGFGDAFEILSQMEGDEVFPEWRGLLNVTYRFGPTMKNGRKIRLQVKNEERTVPIHNVIGKIEGELEPDRYVIFGVHRDAWVYGGLDPASGATIMMEVARIFGKMLETGWRPRRTIMFCSWDAEEYGLVGSYEWVEENMKWLSSNAVAYLNLDTAIGGNRTLLLRTVPLLRQVFFDAAKKVKDPHDDSCSLFDAMRGSQEKPKTGMMGSSSDHTPFIANAGVPALIPRISYSENWNRTSSPLYHTRYETTRVLLMTDPGYKLSRAMTSVMAETGRLLAESLVLPLGIRDYANDLEERVESFVIPLTDIVDKKYIGGLKTGLAAFKEAVKSLEIKIDEVNRKNPIAVRDVNDKLMAVERAFLDSNGVPFRPHYKHLLHTASAMNDYGGSGFPGIQDILYRWHQRNSPRLLRELEGHLSAIAYALFSASKVLLY